MPVTLEESAFLPASPERVWAVLGDPGQAPAHVPPLFSIREQHDAQDDTRRWTVRFELLGKRLEVRAEEAEEVPAQRFALAFAGALRGHFRLELEHEGGGTRLRERVDYGFPAAILDRSLGRMAEPVIRRLMHQHLASLERLLKQQDEGQPSP